MATQLKEPDEIQPEGVEESQEQQEQTRDYEAEARSRGWVPKDEFRGDPARCVDAKTFVERTDDMMPLLKKDRDQWKRRFQDLEKTVNKAQRFFSAAEQRGFKRAKDELEAKLEQAIETGDLAAGKALLADFDKLKDEVTEPAHTKEEALEAFDAFRESNPWYDKGNLGSATELEINARLYADRMAEKHIARTAEMAPPAFFKMLQEMVEEKYPAILVKPVRTKPASDVASPTGGRQPGPRGKTFNDLPVEAQRAADKWIKQGLIKDRAAYVADYDWSQK